MPDALLRREAESRRSSQNGGSSGLRLRHDRRLAAVADVIRARTVGGRLASLHNMTSKDIKCTTCLSNLKLQI